MNEGSPIMPPRLVPVRPKSKAREYHGLFMTLCIGAMADQQKKIITVTDFMLSNNVSSTETWAAKVSRIGKTKRWVAMFAGDPSCNQKILGYVNDELAHHPQETDDDLLNAFKLSYQKEVKNYIEDVILSPLGMSRDEFFKDGKSALGDQQFAILLREIRDARLNTDFLVCGFHEHNPRIFRAIDPGITDLQDSMGFCSIGCGAHLADAHLMSTFSVLDPLQDTLYKLIEAKFKSERAPGVGRRTYMTILEEGGQMVSVPPPVIEEIRAAWEKYGNPPIAPEMRLAMQKLSQENINKFFHFGS